MAATPAVVLLVVVIAVMAISAAEAKMKKRSIEVPTDIHMKSPSISMVKRGHYDVRSIDEPELIRSKRFKRDVQEVELQRVKRMKRDAADGDGDGLERVKRTKRTADDNEIALQRTKRVDNTVDEQALSRQKRFRRSVHINKFDKEAFRMKRGSKAKHIAAHDVYDMPTLRRSKRGGLAKAVDTVKHVKNAHTHTHVHLRDKRRQPINPDGLHESKMGDVIKKAVERLKRSKKGVKHIGKVSKLHRAKRAGLTEKRSEVLKDINRDISRLQRLRRGIAHEVIRDVKRQTRTKNHKIVKRQQDSTRAIHTGVKKQHKALNGL